MEKSVEHKTEYFLNRQISVSQTSAGSPLTQPKLEANLDETGVWSFSFPNRNHKEFFCFFFLNTSTFPVDTKTLNVPKYSLF